MNTLFVQTRIESDWDVTRPYLLSDLLIDGEPIATLEHDGLVIDLVELAKAAERSGEFFIITCVCGEPGCVGIYEGIEATHHSDEVRWLVRGFGPDRVYTFGKEAYATSIKQGLDEFLQFLLDNPSIEPLPGTNEYLATYLSRRTY